MTRRTWQGPVIELPHHDLPAEPDPVEGCDVCAALADQRAAAQRAGDASRVADCNVEMRRHPHPNGRRKR
ncbi:hypothetical protein [Streptomyces sp. NPDC006971]|uniref:hypothetical protein n=1 Tax=Streptomyces sp. NPDC006971 TaxID=3154784 RepID=UPI0033CB69D5